MGEGSPALAVIDEALVRLRRIWSSERSQVHRADGGVIEMSSLLVVEACAQRQASGGLASVGDVAEFCDVEHSTASRLVDRAARAGLVRRVSAPQDARRRALELTPDGARLRAEAVDFRINWLAQVMTDWDRAEIQAFATALARFAGAASGAGRPAVRTGPDPAGGSPGPVPGGVDVVT